MIVAIVATETVVLIMLTVLVAGLLRSHADILRRLHAIDGGGEETTIDAPVTFATQTRVHDIVGAGLRDDARNIVVAGVEHRTMLAFLSSGCLTCGAFWDAFADRASLDLPGDVRIVIVVKDAAEESVSAIRALAPPDLPVVLSSAAWNEYEVPGSPYFVLVDGRTGRIGGEGTGTSWPQVRNLMLQADNDGDATEVRIDRELLAYGIEPGDPSLYPTP